MGLFSNISHEGTEEIYSYEINDKHSCKLLFDFKRECTIEHGNKLTNLIKARILNGYKKECCVAPDLASYVCFEIPTFVSVGELAQNGIFDTLNDMGRFESLDNIKYKHLGIIDRKNEQEYQIYDPTIEVNEYIQSNLDVVVKLNRGIIYNRMQTQGFKERIAEPALRYIEEQKRIKNNRKINPMLEEQFKYRIDGKVYSDCEGTDLAEGKILKINRLNKIGRVDEDEILYSAYIEKLEPGQKREEISLQKNPNGYPILFILYKEIEKLIENDDEKNTERILRLISEIPNEMLNEKRLEFVGELDKEGNIHRDLMRCSQKVQKQIKEQKEKFEKENEEERCNSL